MGVMTFHNREFTVILRINTRNSGKVVLKTSYQCHDHLDMALET